MKYLKLLGLISLALLPTAASSQLYQDASNSTAIGVRDPARQASTEIDAVIFNPAGTAFLDDGWHFSLTGKIGIQSLDLGNEGNSVVNKTRDVRPSLQGAYKKDNLAISLSLGNEGGYGEWFGAENQQLSNIFNDVSNQGLLLYTKTMSSIVNSCSIDDKVINSVIVGGNLYNYTTRIGVSYKMNKNFSVHVGLRVNRYTEKTVISGAHTIKTNNKYRTPQDYFNQIDKEFLSKSKENINLNNGILDLAKKLGIDAPELENITNSYQESVAEVSKMNKEAAGTPINYKVLEQTSKGWGFTPILGVAYQLGSFNFAAKYEFESKVKTNNGSESFHIPSLLSGGISWKVYDNLTISVGSSWKHQETSTVLGSTQQTKLSLNDVVLNFEKGKLEANTNAFIDQETNLDAFDISASISFSPIKNLLLSFGYSYGKDYYAYKSLFPQSMPIPMSVDYDVISGGLCYNISEIVQLDLGISKRMQLGTIINTYESCYWRNHQTTSLAAGINIHL